jgi:hypothetical protein
MIDTQHTAQLTYFLVWRGMDSQTRERQTKSESLQVALAEAGQAGEREEVAEATALAGGW